jgi:3-oxoacyl-[acyl-carrier protein] reductase
MNLGIAGKRALVTGGSSGLGLAASRALAAEGVDLVLFARRQAQLEDARRSLTEEFGVQVDTIAGDLTERRDVAAMAATIANSGGVDVLVLNTPRPPSPMRDFLAEDDDDRWSEAYRGQLHGALNVLREVAPLLVGRGWGRIIGITSATVKQPMPRHAVSSIFRAGVQAALKHLVAELGPHGVTVNSVGPATVMTPTFGQFHDVTARVQALPLQRAGTLEEFGGTVAFLASVQAGFITGQTIQIDGGMTTALV